MYPQIELLFFAYRVAIVCVRYDTPSTGDWLTEKILFALEHDTYLRPCTLISVFIVPGICSLCFTLVAHVFDRVPPQFVQAAVLSSLYLVIFCL